MMKYLTSLVTMRYYNDESMPIAYHLPKFVSTVSSFLESSQVVYWVSPYNRHLERKREVSATHHLMWEFTCWFDYVCYNSLDVLHKSQSAHNMSWPPVLPGRRVTYIYQLGMWDPSWVFVEKTLPHVYCFSASMLLIFNNNVVSTVNLWCLLVSSSSNLPQKSSNYCGSSSDPEVPLGTHQSYMALVHNRDTCWRNSGLTK